jgi:gelsolin
VEGSENPTFLGYFKEFQILEGGVESGFNHVTPTEYCPRMLHLSAPVKIQGKPAPNVCVREVRASIDSMNSGDVFIYDSGTQILQWNGAKSSGIERVKAAEFARRLSDSRKGLAKVTVYDQNDDDNPFFKAFGSDASKVKDPVEFVEVAFETTLHCLRYLNPSLIHSDESGSPVFTEVGRGEGLAKAMLKSDDVFILDTQSILFVWIGSGASRSEKGLALKVAIQYLTDKARPNDLAVTRLREGNENDAFLGIFTK